MSDIFLQSFTKCAQIMRLPIPTKTSFHISPKIIHILKEYIAGIKGVGLKREIVYLPLGKFSPRKGEILTEKKMRFGPSFKKNLLRTLAAYGITGGMVSGGAMGIHKLKKK